MTYGAEHNLYAAVPRKTYFEVDTVVVKEQMAFDQVSQALDVTTEEILYFNPQYRKNIIPAGGNVLCLPKNKIGVFLNNEQAIYSAIHAQQDENNIVEVVSEVKRVHTVKSGEKLSTIARKYGVTMYDIQTWNYIGKRGIKPGKKLIVYVKEQKAQAPEKTEAKPEQNIAAVKDNSTKQLAENNAPAKTDFIFYKVKKGDNLYNIAKRYGVTIQDLKDVNDTKSLYVGRVIKIKAKGE